MTESDREFIEKRIEEIDKILSSERITGRSNRLLNEFIEDFFNKPMGTKILVFDHYFGYNIYGNEFELEFGTSSGARKARQMMCKMIRRRLDNEYPNVKYEITRDFYLIRKSPTYREALKEELKELQKKN